MREKKIELLAPAGSYEGFEAALGAGADAVYMGGTAFGARAYAQNFTQEELLRAIDAAHIHNRKLYLTVNTLLKNRELYEQLYDYLLPYYEAGLDAVIVQDLGVFRFIKENFPGLKLHASTQMTVTGPGGMRFLEEQGASRVVAARELSLEELAAMHRESPIEIEAFVHGALCYSFSGQCLMSSLLGGRSGNRGRCAQPCRLPYRAAHRGEAYKGTKELCPLSLKDICTIELLPEIIQAGVVSLKIEGRMKQPAYTAGVTAVYRDYLDRYLKYGAEGFRAEEKDKSYLLGLFNRGGSCSGYFQMQGGPSMMAFTNEKKTGNVSTEIRKTKEKIHGNLILFPGSPAILEVSCGDIRAAASAGEVQTAQKQPMEEARVRRQMEKLGDTPFEWAQLDITMDDRIFVPVKTLNELRREALAGLESALLDVYRRKAPQPLVTVGAAGEALPSGRDSVGTAPAFYASCERRDTARALCTAGELKGLYLSFDAMEECLPDATAAGKELYLALPHIVRGEPPKAYWKQAEKWLELGMKGFLVRSLEGYALLKKHGLAGHCVLDHSLYTWNDAAVAFWREQGILRITAPLELNGGELRHRDNRDGEFLIYGRLPLMLSAQCLQKNLYSCRKQEDTLMLLDRYNKEFPVFCYCHPWKMLNTEPQGPCYNIIYNSIPYGLLKEKDQVAALGFSSLRLAFTTEEPREAAEILADFHSVYHLGKKPSERTFTKGHFKRGAE